VVAAADDYFGMFATAGGTALPGEDGKAARTHQCRRGPLVRVDGLGAGSGVPLGRFARSFAGVGSRESE
jgi:hypothetical protein